MPALVLLAALTLAGGPPHAGQAAAKPHEAPATAGLRVAGIDIRAVPSPANLSPNPGFEDVRGGTPAGWRWDRRNTDARVSVDTRHRFAGARSIRLDNGTPFGAHVYGMLERTDTIELTPGKTYTLSVWTRSFDPGIAWIGGGSGWQWRLLLPATNGEWRRVHLTFRPDENERRFALRIVTESPNRGVWLDEVALTEGDEPAPTRIDGDLAIARIEPASPSFEIQGDGAREVVFLLSATRRLAGTLEASVGPSRPSKRSVSLAPGGARVAVKLTVREATNAPVPLYLRLRGADGAEVAAARTQLRVYSPTAALARCRAIRRALPALERRLTALERTGADTSYPRVTMTVLANFVGYAEEDARRGEVRRAHQQADEMEPMLAHLDRELRDVEERRRRLPAVPRWTGAARPVIQSSSFLAPVRTPGAPGVAWRPVFFNGFGHFGQVVSDIDKWPAYGTNIIQIEFGPNSIFPEEGRVDDTRVRQVRALLDRAQQMGVAVNLLVSPHYMPAWVLEKWPHLRKRREGFLQYCLHAPEGQEVLRRFLLTALPPLKDHPALHSICLSNEPVNVEEPCEHATRLWHDWLRRRHGDVATLNERWGARWESFDAVPLPDPFAGPPADRARWMDFIRFNQEFFADWHGLMARAIHTIAPDLPVHAKAMNWTMTDDVFVRFGVDPYLFGKVTDINGNDAACWYNRTPQDFAQGWHANAFGHDLQRSCLDAPVFNSENHLIVDRDTEPVPAAHVRAALWQAAIHGQSATTIWVWERTFDPKSDFAGSIMHRPACAEAVGRTNLDLNRAALEVTAIQQAPPDVELLQAVSGHVWDGGRVSDCAYKLHMAFTMLGLKAGFITERQLEEGVTPRSRLLLVPNVSHLSDAARATLSRWRGRLVLVGGDDLLTRNEYGAPRDPLPGERMPFAHGKGGWREMLGAVRSRLAAWKLRPPLQVTGPAGEPVAGVEWRCARTPSGVVANLCNHLSKPVRLRLSAPAVDALTGAPIAGPFTLQPMEARLVRVRPPAATRGGSRPSPLPGAPGGRRPPRSAPAADGASPAARGPAAPAR